MSTQGPTDESGKESPGPEPAPTPAPAPEDVLSSPPPVRDLGSVLAERPRNGRLPTSTAVLVAIVLLAVGFLGGLLVGRSTASGNQTSAARGGFPGGFPTPSGGVPGGAGGTSGAGGGIASGTVTRVDGDTLYVKTADGKTVKVVVSSDTTISVSKEGTLADISKGSTVFVRGTSSNGALSATTIMEGDFQLGFLGGPGFGSPGASPSSGG
jgi:hypothetical protein